MLWWMGVTVNARASANLKFEFDAFPSDPEDSPPATYRIPSDLRKSYCQRRTPSTTIMTSVW